MVTSSPRTLKFVFTVVLTIYFFYLVFSNIPATWAAWGIHRAAPVLWLNGVNGTVWHGRAGRAQLDMAGAAPLALGKVTWDLSPWSLLILRPCVRFASEVPGQQISGVACRGLTGTTQVRDLDLTAPIAAIKPLLQFDATGSLSMQVPKAQIAANGKVSRLDARLSWQNARAFTGENWLSLGAFGATAEADGQGGVRAKVFDLSGPYKSDIEARWAPGQENWQLSGTIHPQEGAAPVVRQILQVLGEELDSGAYRVNWP